MSLVGLLLVVAVLLPCCASHPDVCPVTPRASSSMCLCVRAHIVCTGLVGVPIITPGDTSLYDVIYMFEQSIREVPDSAFNGLRVRNIVLSGNSLGDQIRRDAFRGVNLYLEGLYLVHCDIPALPEGLLVGMDHLLTLSLSANYIRHIPQQYFSNASHLVNLDLSQNHLTHIAQNTFVGSLSLTLLDLSHNLIKLDDYIFHHMSNLEELYLNHNDIDEIPPKLFMNQASLKLLTLNNNFITAMYNELAYNLRGLETLHLEDNQISELSQNFLLYLDNIRVLKLQRNKLRGIPDDAFANAPNLRELDLSNNKLRRLPISLFQYCYNMNTINLGHNRLRGLAACTLPVMFDQLGTVSLAANPVECSCAMSWVQSLTVDNVTVYGTCVGNGLDIVDRSNYIGCAVPTRPDCY